MAASRCADSSAISSPSRSSSATRSGVGKKLASGFPWRASLLLGRLYTRLSEPPAAARTGDRGTSDDFWSGPARPPIAGAVRAAEPASAGAADTRPFRWTGVKRKSQAASAAGQGDHLADALAIFAFEVGFDLVVKRTVGGGEI